MPVFAQFVTGSVPPFSDIYIPRGPFEREAALIPVGLTDCMVSMRLSFDTDPVLTSQRASLRRLLTVRQSLRIGYRRVVSSMG